MSNKNKDNLGPVLALGAGGILFGLAVGTKKGREITSRVADSYISASNQAELRQLRVDLLEEELRLAKMDNGLGIFLFINDEARTVHRRIEVLKAAIARLERRMW
jgi:hypothetical protein